MFLRTFLGVGSSLAPAEERYWRTVGGGMTATGIPVTPQTAFQVSCIFQGVRLIAETLGSLPLILYRQREDGGKDRAREHPLWRVLRRVPNVWQTSQEFREVMTARAILWPGAYAEINPDEQNVVGELVPIDPETVLVEQLPSGRLRYTYRDIAGLQQVRMQEDIFRLPSFGVHRFMGANLLHLCREAIGLWLAQEKFGAHFFRHGAQPSLLAEHPAKLTGPQFEQLKASIDDKVSGVANAWKILVAQDGMKWSHVGFNARESQLTEFRVEMALEIARWLNIPPFLMGIKDTTSDATAENRARQFVDVTLRPWAVRWEGAIARDLLLEDGDEVFAEFLLDALLRGDTRERFESYGIGIMNGFMSENEVRIRENMNPVPGLDEPRRSANQDRGGDPTGPRQSVPAPAAPRPRGPAAPPDQSEDDPAEARVMVVREPRRLELIARQAADRVVRREIASVTKKATALASDPAAWAAWLTTFYEAHAALVSETLQLEPACAHAYAEGHRLALLAEGLAVTEHWAHASTRALVALVLEEAADHART